MPLCATDVYCVVGYAVCHTYQKITREVYHLDKCHRDRMSLIVQVSTKLLLSLTNKLVNLTKALVDLTKVLVKLTNALVTLTEF